VLFPERERLNRPSILTIIIMTAMTIRICMKEPTLGTTSQPISQARTIIATIAQIITFTLP